MKRCDECRKHAKELDTPWTRFRWSIFQRFFRWEIRDVEQSYYTKGVADGFREGSKYQTELNTYEKVVL